MTAADDPVVIFRTHSDIEASIVSGLLEAHGLRTAVASDVPHAVFPITVDGLGEVRISVRASDADDARRIIEGHRDEVTRRQAVELPDNLGDFEDRCGYRFADPSLLLRALTHRSHAHEDPTGASRDNESLEFLGDSVLGFVIADTLYRQFPQLDEGQQSKIKSSLVSTTTLARLARRLGLGDHLVLGRGEEKTGGRRKPALLADGFEAVIAAVYLDGGIEAARAFVHRHFAPELEEVRSPKFWEHDYKSWLQEFVQGRELPLPEYVVVAETGPDHRKLFEVEVIVDGRAAGRATGRSKKEAEQQAARQALEELGATDFPR
jgi:ribonuclease-3